MRVGDVDLIETLLAGAAGCAETGAKAACQFPSSTEVEQCLAQLRHLLAQLADFQLTRD